MSPNKRSPNKLTKVPPMLSMSNPMKRPSSFDISGESPLPTPPPISAGSSAIPNFPFPDVSINPMGPKNGGVSNDSSPGTNSSAGGHSSNLSTSTDPGSLFHCSDTASASSTSSLASSVKEHLHLSSNARGGSDFKSSSPLAQEKPSSPHHQASTVRSPQPQSTSGSDRASSASLPLPLHVPYSSLPRKNDHDTIIHRMTNATLLPASALPSRYSAPPRRASPQSADRAPQGVRSSYPASSFPETGTTSIHPSSGTTLNIGGSLSPNGHSAFYRKAVYPVPDPPTIIDANDVPISPVSSNGHRSRNDDGSSSSSAYAGSAPCNTNAPYSNFLSQLPPPKDTYIECQTHPSSYLLFVNLPGFKRDGITLATKRRRILHVVADSWADPTLLPVPEHAECKAGEVDLPDAKHKSTSLQKPQETGGHFERRISFGYDADLVQVRAEFDGEVLKIHIPRKPLAQCWAKLS